MKTTALKCPQCDATLEPVDGLDTFYCQYCGHKIVLEDMSPSAYGARIAAMAIEDKKDKRQHKQRVREWKAEKERKSIKGFIICIVCFVLFFVCIFGFVSCKHSQKIDELESIEEQMTIAYEEGDYDKALILANQLHCDDDYSHEEAEAWDDKREAYIDMIEKKIKGK